jgi:hypothetical protein
MKDAKILQIHQNSARFSGRYCVYKMYEIAHAFDAGIDIGNNLEKGKDIMLMGNHGKFSILFSF